MRTLKTFKSDDVHVIQNRGTLYMIKRATPWSNLAPGEMPKVGEVVLIDGVERTLGEVQLFEGSMGYKPHIGLVVKL